MCVVWNLFFFIFYFLFFIFYFSWGCCYCWPIPEAGIFFGEDMVVEIFLWHELCVDFSRGDFWWVVLSSGIWWSCFLGCVVVVIFFGVIMSASQVEVCFWWVILCGWFLMVHIGWCKMGAEFCGPLSASQVDMVLWVILWRWWSYYDHQRHGYTEHITQKNIFTRHTNKI